MNANRWASATLALAFPLIAACGDVSSGSDETSARGFTRVAAVQFEAPFLYQKGEDKVGPEARLLELTLEKLNARRLEEGLRPNQLLWVKRDSGAVLSAVASDDAEYGAGLIAVRDEGGEQVDFSDSFYTSELVLIFNPAHKPVTADQLEGVRVGVRQGTAVSKHFQQRHPEAKAVPFSSLNEALLALRRGEIEAVVDDRLMAAHSLDTVTGLGHLEVMPGRLGSLDIAVAVRKDNEALLRAVNEAVAEMKESGAFESFLSGNAGETARRVENRYSDRIERERKAVAPRSFVLRLSKDPGSPFDIYRLANLRFQLRNRETGKTHSTTRVSFRKRIGIASASLPPGSYTLHLPKFGNTALGEVMVRPQDRDRINYNLRWGADDRIALTLAGG